jgi:hypothetical protein
MIGDARNDYTLSAFSRCQEITKRLLVAHGELQSARMHLDAAQSVLGQSFDLVSKDISYAQAVFDATNLEVSELCFPKRPITFPSMKSASSPAQQTPHLAPQVVKMHVVQQEAPLFSRAEEDEIERAADAADARWKEDARRKMEVRILLRRRGIFR